MLPTIVARDSYVAAQRSAPAARAARPEADPPANAAAHAVVLPFKQRRRDPDAMLGHAPNHGTDGAVA